jgi:hypothetical protein
MWHLQRRADGFEEGMSQACQKAQV